MTCSFCAFIAERTKPGQEDFPFESPEIVGWFDAHPVSPGHFLLVPRRHVGKLTDMTSEEVARLFSALRHAKSLIESLDVARMRKLYGALRAQRVSENSPLFIEKVLEHPCLGQKPHGYNHGVNEGVAGGQTVDHLHWHIIPRYIGDVPDPRGGVRAVFPKLANYQ